VVESAFFESDFLVVGSGVVAIGASGFHSFALTDHEVWGFGRNDYGQVGSGDYALATPLPVSVQESAGVIAIAGGLWHSLGVGPAPVVSGGAVQNRFRTTSRQFVDHVSHRDAHQLRCA
jgi:hypothetical protein